MTEHRCLFCGEEIPEGRQICPNCEQNISAKVFNNQLKPCPFCGGKAKIVSKQKQFIGWRCNGLKVIKWLIYIKCNRCHSRSKPITTGPMEENWNRTKFSGFPIGVREEATLAFEPYVLKAIEAWNKRGE